MAYRNSDTEFTLPATIMLSIALHAAAVALLPAFQFDTEPPPRQIQVELQPPKPEPPPPPLPEPEPPKPEPIKPQPKIIPPPKVTPLPPVPEKVAEVPPPVAPPPPPPVIATAPVEDVKPTFVAPPAPEQPRDPQPVVDVDADLGKYGSLLAREFAKHKQYPRIAQMRGWQGTVRVKLEVDAHGAIISSTISESSGYEALDKQALEMVKKASPLPQPPASLRNRPFTITVPVLFRLE